ncbi:cytochrome P450 [Aspergillus eucalypticola CBS 122712]|uniref:Cytochrome P450 n=1 Tax=Aspergillus eucalypticola (strain CBS 122712 / IBT 29274) TaxID=1448314 RepID=A0A317VMF0_ASPEC|nr:cytochrome P450 [Aspergillus eucalypticola CBS 122712]PWY74267.1 cytochrome P450 [Aspergillus eucalypticola CBS 122712]
MPICRGSLRPCHALPPTISSKGLFACLKSYVANAYEKVAHRLSRKDLDRKDFKSYILRHNDERGLSLPEILETAIILIIAGSETAATFLSGFTYYLLKHPRAYKRVVAEIGSNFSTMDEITIIATQDMQYLAAVEDEAFRMYPPPNAFPRIVPRGGAEIDGGWVPGDATVGINQWAANYDPGNFNVLVIAAQVSARKTDRSYTGSSVRSRGQQLVSLGRHPILKMASKRRKEKGNRK